MHEIAAGGELVLLYRSHELFDLSQPNDLPSSKILTDDGRARRPGSRQHRFRRSPEASIDDRAVFLACRRDCPRAITRNENILSAHERRLAMRAIAGCGRASLAWSTVSIYIIHIYRISLFGKRQDANDMAL